MSMICSAMAWLRANESRELLVTNDTSAETATTVRGRMDYLFTFTYNKAYVYHHIYCFTSDSHVFHPRHHHHHDHHHRHHASHMFAATIITDTTTPHLYHQSTIDSEPSWVRTHAAQAALEAAQRAKREREEQRAEIARKREETRKRVQLLHQAKRMRRTGQEQDDKEMIFLCSFHGLLLLRD